MEIHFLGAAQTVTGSHHLLIINGKKILLDFGMFQGKRKEAFEKNRQINFDPAEIDIVLLSHAHIDHSGNLPSLVNKNFKGIIYTTNATVDLCQIMLRDSAYLQTRDVEIVNRKRAKQHKNLFEPLYTVNEVEQIMTHFVGVQYNKQLNICEGVKVTFRDAGHILGSAGIELEITENNKTYTLGFTGDIGRKDMPILNNPDVLRGMDYLIMESTYGGRIHDKTEDVEQELVDVINETVKNKGKVIVPSFAVGRTQLLVYMLHKLWEQNRLPEIPIYVDSPLAVRSTEVFRNHPECFDRETYSLFIKNHEDPFGFEKIKYITEVEDSKKLNNYKEPCIIISASGMAEAGRILHHLANNVQNPNNLVLFVGYAAVNTLARKIMDGERQVNILGEPYEIKCKIKKMDYFSAHAGQDGLIEYVKYTSPEKLKKIFIVHGEEEQALELKKKLEDEGYKDVYYPKEEEIHTV